MASQWDDYERCPALFHLWKNKSESRKLQCIKHAGHKEKKHKAIRPGGIVEWKAAPNAESLSS